MEEFYDLFNELSTLKSKYDSLKNGELIILYGRRRIGKTELVLKFLQHVKSKNIYIYINKLARRNLMKQFSNDISEQTNDNVMMSDSWGPFFSYLVEESKENKFVLIVDEFQRLSDISEDFITMLQHKWDSNLKTSKIMIILLGSSMGMAHDLIFSSKGPLYGRLTHNMKIKPFRYVDFREMFNSLKNEEEKIKFFSVFGGTAHYLSLVKKKNKTLFNTIEGLVLTEGSPLYDEPVRLLSSELKSYGKHNSILISIAKGEHELPDIANSLGLEQSQITPHINHLVNRLDILRKREPIFGKKKKTRYEISDNFFNFWYRFVLPSTSTLEMKNKALVLKKIKEQLNGYVSRRFEEICRELLILYNNDKIKGFNINFEKIGSWWEGGEEIDLVAYSKREIILGEVKWQNNPINGLALYNDLERKSKKIEFNGRVRYIIISKSGFVNDTRETLEEMGVICLDLDDLSSLFDNVAKKESAKQRKLESYF